MAPAREHLGENELYEIVAETFERIRPRKCPTCTLPRPIRIAPLEGDGTNWIVLLSPACESECGGLMRLVWQQCRAKYDLAPAL